MSVAEMIYVLRRYQDGKQIQWRFKGLDNWEDCTNKDGPDWAFNTRDYRVKPEPREWWILPGSNDGSVLDYNPLGPMYVRVREVLE